MLPTVKIQDITTDKNVHKSLLRSTQENSCSFTTIVELPCIHFVNKYFLVFLHFPYT